MVISCFFFCLFYSLQVSTGLLEKARNPSIQRYKLGLYKEGKKGFFSVISTCSKKLLMGATTSLIKENLINFKIE